MSPMPSANRRPFNTRARSARRSRLSASLADGLLLAEPPLKKRRYVPGGPGGGGRYVDTDGTEIAVGGTGPGGYNYIGLRGRVGRENLANGLQPEVYQRPRRESRRERPPPRPSFTSAAATTAAVVQGDGFKPREERSWEEFHQDLDIEFKFPIFSADEVDGITNPAATPCLKEKSLNGISLPEEDIKPFALETDREQQNGFHENGIVCKTPANTEGIGIATGSPDEVCITPSRRRPGRPPRRPDSMLKGIGTPDTPKPVPLPGPNPREKLTLPKPSFRILDPFTAYEQNGAGQQNYVDRSMAHVGYQESDIYIRPDKSLIRVTEGNIEEDLDIAHIMPGVKNDSESNAAIGGVGVGRVEYDMDEQDTKWLEAYNLQRKAEQIEPIKPAVFEITMTKIEKEWHSLEKRIPKPNPKPPQTHRPRSSSTAAMNGEPAASGEEQDSKCAICDDGDCENTNAIVFCDGCDLAVHQECYGVPFIPEGQWLCRKCHLIGRGTPTCIFCPNTDGAFKQTNSSRWSHLLCAIWIPEVSLGNATYMEPVMDVEKVPKQRWKLTCYICRQKMGACIQCGNKNCFVAFHVTCARRARLFLKMKSGHGNPASLDASVLKAYCDKHVPSEWRRENDVDTATAEAIDYYHYTMRGRLWADSQQTALAMTEENGFEAPISEQAEEAKTPRINLVLNANRRKRTQAPKIVWRLPSGAPVIPSAVYNSVESSLQRFTIRKRKEYAAEACKYWTLKRESRRGAALLKRLQLQMETFTSMEITRRNFIGMGAAGKVRLQRRIDFAETLRRDVEALRVSCELIKQREQEKLRDAEMLKDIVDMVYFPITPLLWPILERAQTLDGKGVFQEGFTKLRDKLSERFYTSVSSFSAEFGSIFSAATGLPEAADAADVQAQISSEPPAKDVTTEYKEKKKLAKRIIKAVQGSLEDATRKESELCRKPFEKELRHLDLLLQNSFLSRRDSLANSSAGEVNEVDAEDQISTPGREGGYHTTGIKSSSPTEDYVTSIPRHENPVAPHSEVSPTDLSLSSLTLPPEESRRIVAAETNVPDSRIKSLPTEHVFPTHQPTPEDSSGTPLTNSVATRGLDLMIPEEEEHHEADQADEARPHVEPLTPALSSEEEVHPFANGGIPWYMVPFDPVGTTIEEERWTGRDMVRGMSEELSDMDEDELSGLVDLGTAAGGPPSEAADGALHPDASAVPLKRPKAAVKRKRWRGYK